MLPHDERTLRFTHWLSRSPANMDFEHCVLDAVSHTMIHYCAIASLHTYIDMFKGDVRGTYFSLPPWTFLEQKLSGPWFEWSRIRPMLTKFSHSERLSAPLVVEMSTHVSAHLRRLRRGELQQDSLASLSLALICFCFACHQDDRL